MGFHWRTPFLAALLGFHCVASEKNAADIPRANTPSPEKGEWPNVTGVMGCGFPGIPKTGTLDKCTEPLDPLAPDLRGYWQTQDGDIDEYIEMCGSRWIDVSKPVLHDFPVCTGVVGDGKGCQDYSGPAIASNWTSKEGGECRPIETACKFETDDEGNGCVNLYTKNQTTGVDGKVVSRCLQSDQTTMIWIHPQVGKVVYTRVPPEEEPNCMVCEGGEHDGFFTYSTDQINSEMPCPYEERRWKRCNVYLTGPRLALLAVIVVAVFLVFAAVNWFVSKQRDKKAMAAAVL